MAKTSKTRTVSKKQVSAGGATIAKRNHAPSKVSSTHQKDKGIVRKRELLKKLEAGSKVRSSLGTKKRGKRKSESTVLSAVRGIAASLQDLTAASDARASSSSYTHAQNGGISLTSKKRWLFSRSAFAFMLTISCPIGWTQPCSLALSQATARRRGNETFTAST